MADPIDPTPLAVLSDFLKDHGAHHLLSACEDPVRELLALREQLKNAVTVRVEPAAIPRSASDLGQVDYGQRVTLTFRGVTVREAHREGTLAMAGALVRLATEVDARWPHRLEGGSRVLLVGTPVREDNPLTRFIERATERPLLDWQRGLVELVDEAATPAVPKAAESEPCLHARRRQSIASPGWARCIDCDMELNPREAQAAARRASRR